MRKESCLRPGSRQPKSEPVNAQPSPLRCSKREQNTRQAMFGRERGTTRKLVCDRYLSS